MFRSREGDELRGLQGLERGLAAGGEEEGDAVEGFEVSFADGSDNRGAGAGAGGRGGGRGRGEANGVWVLVVYAYVGGWGGGCVLL